MASTHYGFCNFCDAVCGLEIVHEDKKILSVRGDEQDPFSLGHTCPKAFAQQDIYTDPDRIRKPLRRKGKDWEEISWGEALAEAGERCAQIQNQHGADALAFYFGNPISHNYSAMLHLLPFARGLRTKNVYSSGSVDAFSRMLVSQLLYGSPAALPIPDIERTNYFLILGANPVVSNGSIMTAPDCKRRLREIKERGGKIVVIDPRRTETADIATEHHFIEPAGDTLFLLAMLHVFFAEKLTRLDRMPVAYDGLDELESLIRDFSPAIVADHIGIAGPEITRIARDFAAAKGAACYGRMGTSVQSFGTLATWLVDMVNIVTGNMDHAGGVMFNTPALDLVGLAKKLGQAGSFGAYRSRIRGFRELNGEFPVAALYDELATPGPGQIRGLITWSGNMSMSIPNGRRVDRLLEKLDYMVSVDFYLNETTRHANLILPPVTSLESDHYPLLEHNMAVRNTVHYAPALFAKDDDAMQDYEILAHLSDAIGKHRGGLQRLTGILHKQVGTRLAPARILDLLLRTGPQKLTLKKLKENPHGIDLGLLEPRLAKILSTSTGRISLVPADIRNDFPRLRQSMLSTPRRAGEFSLIGRRTLRSMNSWLHNSKRLVTGKPRCNVVMHPDDASRLHLADGTMLQLASRVGVIEVQLHISDEIKPGVLCMPYGWGHNRPGASMSVAAATSGASYNDLVDDEGFDPVSGASVLNGVRVTVSPVA